MKNEFKDSTILGTVQDIKKEEPKLYQVTMHKDDYTPMEFVVEILEQFFFLERRAATEVMMEVHLAGKSTCGVFTKEVAESKISQVKEHARVHEHPLTCSMEAAT